MTNIVSQLWNVFFPPSGQEFGVLYASVLYPEGKIHIQTLSKNPSVIQIRQEIRNCFIDNNNANKILLMHRDLDDMHTVWYDLNAKDNFKSLNYPLHQRWPVQCDSHRIYGKALILTFDENRRYASCILHDIIQEIEEEKKEEEEEEQTKQNLRRSARLRAKRSRKRKRKS